MTLRQRVQQVSAVLLGILVVGSGTYYLLTTFHVFHRRPEPVACSGPTRAAPVQDTMALTSGGEELASWSPAGGELEAVRSASGPLVAAPASSPSTRRADALQASAQHVQATRLLDGGSGPLPENAMDCHFDGGFQCGACQTDADCPAGQACTVDFHKGRFECVASECEDDQGCFPGTVCRNIALLEGASPVRRCILTGDRSEGELCNSIPASTREACREGLLCVGERCGRPCKLGAPGACSEGWTCRASRNGAACVPDCRVGGCSQGTSCIALGEDGPHECVRLVVDACDDRRPCPDGQHCLVNRQGERAGRFCAAACQPWRPDSCPQGYVCGRGGPTKSSCYLACNPQDLTTCPAGWLCKTVSEDLQTWGCRPDVNL